MDNKNVLNNEDLDKVSGGSGNITTCRIHSNCGGHITCEDSGTYSEDIWLTCQKCGKTWHPHSWSRVDQCEDVYTVTHGTF